MFSIRVRHFNPLQLWFPLQEKETIEKGHQSPPTLILSKPYVLQIFFSQSFATCQFGIFISTDAMSSSFYYSCRCSNGIFAKTCYLKLYSRFSPNFTARVGAYFVVLLHLEFNLKRSPLDLQQCCLHKSLLQKLFY